MIPHLLKSHSDSSFTAIVEELTRARLATIRSFPPGVVLVQQGSVVRQLHLLAKGITKRTFLERNGRELIVGLRYGPGMIAGDYTMLGISCPLTVTTVSQCSVYLVPAQALQQLLEGKPKFTLHISRLLACESAEYASALMEFSSASTRQRLVELLKKLGGSSRLSDTTSAEVNVHLKNYEMAELLAVTPEHLSRLVRSLRREGVLRRDRRNVVLCETGQRGAARSVDRDEAVVLRNGSNCDVWLQGTLADVKSGRRAGTLVQILPQSPMSDVQSRDSGNKQALRRVAIEEMNAKHQITRAFFYSQDQFCRQFQIKVGTGLCAGLVQVWWSEKRRGNDAIARLRNATPALVHDVLVSQARSIYLKDIPATEGKLNRTEAELLKFKYGTDSLSEIIALQDIFGVKTMLEVDLTLQQEARIEDRWMFTEWGSSVVDALTNSRDPGLRLLMLHYRRTRRGGEGGHRSALTIEEDGSCAFYDPSTGETTFPQISDFAIWIKEYWSVRGWAQLLRRGATDLPPIQVFFFKGELEKAAGEKALRLRRRLWTLPLNRALMWV